MTEMTQQRWWVSWYDGGSFEYDGPWWITGYDARDRATICAAVVAGSEKEAQAVILNAHDVVPYALDWRFVTPQDQDWSPFCDRFPAAEWMRWPSTPATT